MVQPEYDNTVEPLYQEFKDTGTSIIQAAK